MSSKFEWPSSDALLRLDGQTAIVTGAGAGIGRGCAFMLASAGAAVVVVDREQDAAEATAAFIGEHGGRAAAIAADVTDPVATGKVFDTAISRFGQLDVLVNNAGIYPRTPALPDIDWDVYRRTYEVNVHGTLRYICDAARLMQSGGRIVNVSSVVSLRPAGPGIAHYSSSKAAINAITRAAAVDFASRGLRANAVLPGIIATEGTTEMQSAFDYFVQRTPSGRIGTPDDIAAAVLFLSSPASSYINGQCLVVDGGGSIVG